MQRYIIIRFGQGIIALWLVTVIVFGISRGTGDPSSIFLGIDARQEDREAARERWGLDKPIVQQYGIFLGKALRGDLGESLKFPELGAAGVVFHRLPATLYLAGVSLILAIGIGVPLGVLSAVKRDTIFDTSSKVLALLGQSVPNFWLGLMMMWLFAVQLGWLPTSGQGDGNTSSCRPSPWDRSKSRRLPG
jgi:peptide/nickel transport system permease protein